MDTTYISDTVQPAGASLRHRLLAFFIIAGTVAALICLRLFDPATKGQNIYPACPFNYLTGLHCPGCGTLRGLHQLLNGHPLVALDLNPLMALSLPFIGYSLVSYTLFAIRGRRLPSVFIRPVFIKMLFWAVISFWILRNIPVYPFTVLAP